MWVGSAFFRPGGKTNDARNGTAGDSSRSAVPRRVGRGTAGSQTTRTMATDETRARRGPRLSVRLAVRLTTTTGEAK